MKNTCIVALCVAGATVCAMGDSPRAQLVPDGLTVRELDVGTSLFRDRSFTLKELPDALKGCLFVAGPFDGAPRVRAEVARDGVLTVISPASGRVSQAETLKAQGFALDASVPVFQAWGAYACDRADQAKCPGASWQQPMLAKKIFLNSPNLILRMREVYHILAAAADFPRLTALRTI